MQKEILRIQGKEVDTTPNSIDRTLQINDLGSAESRQSSYSQTIKLPKTSRNQMVFNFLGVVGSVSITPYRQLICDYIVDGIPLISKGYVEVKATSEYYEVVIYDGVIDLSERLKNKTLSELNYSDLNHELTTTAWQDSLTNTSGYIYGLADYNVDSIFFDKSINVERQIASIYTHTLFNKIFDELGIVLESTNDFFTTNTDYLTEVVTPPIGYEVEEVNQTSAAIGSYNTTTEGRNDISQNEVTYTDTLGFNSTFTDSRLTFGSNGLITVNDDISVQLDLNISYTNAYSGSYVRFVVYQNSTAIKTYGLPSNGTSTIEQLNITAKAGDTLVLKVKGTGQFNSTNPGFYEVNYSASAAIDFTELSGGFVVDFSNMMGDTTQINFIKDVMQRYGLILKPTKGSTDSYTFIQMENLLEDRVGAEDWTDKLVSVGKESYGVKYAKINKAEYKYNENIKIPTQDGFLLIDNENVESEKTLFTSVFEIPSTFSQFLGEPIYLHPMWETRIEIDEGTGVEVVDVKETKLRTFRIKPITGTIDAYFFTDTNPTTYNGTIPFLSLDNMSMQYYLGLYYKAYKFAINRYKEVDVELKLNNMDVYNLDFFKLKYFKQTGKYYYLNNLKHTAGEISKAQLIELNEFEGNQPPILGEFTTSTTFGATKTITEPFFTTSTIPQYLDPEGDAPLKIKFVSNSPTTVKLFQNGVEVVNGTEILFSVLDMTMVDQATETFAHTEEWDFQIADVGSGEYGFSIGTLHVNVPTN